MLYCNLIPIYNYCNSTSITSTTNNNVGGRKNNQVKTGFQGLLKEYQNRYTQLKDMRL